MLTLALTAAVPATVDPEAGEVIVTTRLPVGKGGSMGGSSCASARGGMQLAPKIISKTATRTLFLFFSMDNASSTYRRSIEISALPSLGNHIKGIYQDPGIRRKRVLAQDLDRQGMGPGGQATREEISVLGSFRLSERIDGVRNDVSVEEYAGHPGLRATCADPADPRPREADGRLRAHGFGFRGAPFAVGLVPIVLNPAVAVGDGWVRVLVARS